MDVNVSHTLAPAECGQVSRAYEQAEITSPIPDWSTQIEPKAQRTNGAARTNKQAQQARCWRRKHVVRRGRPIAKLCTCRTRRLRVERKTGSTPRRQLLDSARRNVRCWVPSTRYPRRNGDDIERHVTGEQEPGEDA